MPDAPREEDSPKDNLAVAREAFAALNTGGPEAVIPYIAPDFEATTPPALASEPDTYRGPEGIRRWFSTFYDAVDRIRFEAHEFVAVGEQVMIPFTLFARGRTTGIEAGQNAVMLWTIRSGKAVRLELFTTREEAMAAAEASG